MGSQNSYKKFMPISALALLAVTRVGWAIQPPPAQIGNPISANPIEADGAYTNAGEWSDITPAWFISSPTTGATPTFKGDPNANSLLFAGLSRDTPTSAPELYLMYDYLPRTLGPTGPNQFLGSVSFPLTIDGQKGENATVSFQTTPTFDPLHPTPNFFTATVSLNGGAPIDASLLGIEAGVGPGQTPVNALWGVGAASPFHTTVHELMELGVPLDISPQFAAAGGSGSPFPAGGQSGPDGSGGAAGGGGGSGYSPDPAFWNSDITDNSGDPPASGGLFQIMPDGSTLIAPTFVPLPEPASLGMLAVGGLLLGTRRRRASR